MSIWTGKVGDRVKKYEKKGRESGQATVEWALVLPVFLLLVFGIIDFSWIGYQRLMFESSFQMTAWDFALKIPLTDQNVLDQITPPSYNISSPGVVNVGNNHYALGEGIKMHMLQYSSGLLKKDKLTVTKADAVFEIKQIKDYYRIAGKSICVENYELQVNLKGDLEYRVELLTPVGRTLFRSNEIVLKKNLVRKRTERVVVKRRVVIPSEISE